MAGVNASFAIRTGTRFFVLAKKAAALSSISGRDRSTRSASLERKRYCHPIFCYNYGI